MDCFADGDGAEPDRGEAGECGCEPTDRPVRSGTLTICRDSSAIGDYSHAMTMYTVRIER